MRRAPWLILLAGLAACARGARPIMLDDDRRPSRRSPEMDERSANEAIRDIERRTQAGDLPKIQFEFNSDQITPESYPTLDRIAQVVLTSERLKLLIKAYADDVGDAAYNRELSDRRAKSVKSYLVLKGVPPPSIRFHGFGAENPIADNNTEEGRAKNRRVEFHVTSREWNAVY